MGQGQKVGLPHVPQISCPAWGARKSWVRSSCPTASGHGTRRTTAHFPIEVLISVRTLVKQVRRGAPCAVVLTGSTSACLARLWGADATPAVPWQPRCDVGRRFLCAVFRSREPLWQLGRLSLWSRGEIVGDLLLPRVRLIPCSLFWNDMFALEGLVRPPSARPIDTGERPRRRAGRDLPPDHQAE